MNMCYAAASRGCTGSNENLLLSTCGNLPHELLASRMQFLKGELKKKCNQATWVSYHDCGLPTVAGRRRLIPNKGGSEHLRFSP